MKATRLTEVEFASSIDHATILSLARDSMAALGGQPAAFDIPNGIAEGRFPFGNDSIVVRALCWANERPTLPNSITFSATVNGLPDLTDRAQNWIRDVADTFADRLSILVLEPSRERQQVPEALAPGKPASPLLRPPKASDSLSASNGDHDLEPLLDSGRLAQRPTQNSLLDIRSVTNVDWVEKIGAAESAGSAVVIFHTSAYATTPIFQHLVKRLTAQILPHAGPHHVFRFLLDSHPTFATDLVRRLGIWNVRVQNAGVLWSSKSTSYVFGDQALASLETLDHHLNALCVNREIKLPSESRLSTSDMAPKSPATMQPTTATQTTGLRRAFVVGGLAVLVLVGLIALFSGNPAYVSQCHSLWQSQEGRLYPAHDVSRERVGSGELTNRSDSRVLGFYTDFILTLRFRNVEKQSRIYLRCVANTQKTFIYMRTENPEIVRGSRGLLGISFIRANGSQTSIEPPLE